MIFTISTLVGCLLGLLVFWLVTMPDRHRRREDAFYLSECSRETRLAARALEEKNIEQYEFHMVQAMVFFDKISRFQDKSGGR